MKKLLAILLTVASINLVAQNTINGSSFMVKEEQVQIENDNRTWLFLSGVAFASLGAITRNDWNGTPGEKGLTYGTILLGTGLITGSVVFDIGNNREKKKITDP